MQIITLQDTRLLEWANKKLGTSFEEASCRWVAGLDNGGVIFVVVYSRFSPRNCELSIATDGTKRWASKQSLRAIFCHPFLQWNLKRVTFVIREDNEQSLRMIGKIGAVMEGVVREAFDDGVGGVIFGMLKKECRWLNFEGLEHDRQAAAVAH